MTTATVYALDMASVDPDASGIGTLEWRASVHDLIETLRTWAHAGWFETVEHEVVIATVKVPLDRIDTTDLYDLRPSETEWITGYVESCMSSGQVEQSRRVVLYGSGFPEAEMARIVAEIAG